VTPYRAVIVSTAVLALSSCMVGPKYVKPSVPMAPAYKEATPDMYKENANWQVAQPADAVQRGEWWKIFGDAELNAGEDLLHVVVADGAQAV